jgi:hypothetical protein
MGYKPKFNKAQLEWANKQTLSCRQAAKLLGVSYNTYKKYAKLYGVFDEQKNPSGVGIPRYREDMYAVNINDIFDGKHPNYPHYKLQERLIKNGLLLQACSNCGYDEVRDKDLKGPYLLNFLDGDYKNMSRDNITLICYNCFFLMKRPGRTITTPANVGVLRRKLLEIYDEEDDETQSE